MKTGKINIDEPIVPVELHTNSYLYTVLAYNEDGEVVGETTYNTRFNTEFKTTYEYTNNADGTKTLYAYSDNSGNIYEYDENGSLESIKYYHGYEIVPVQYFLGEGALMDSTDLTTDVVFMPLSKVLAKQNQH